MASVVIGGYAADTKRTPDWLVLSWRASLGTTVLAGARFLLHHMSNLQAQASYIEREMLHLAQRQGRKRRKGKQKKERPHKRTRKRGQGAYHKGRPQPAYYFDLNQG